ncbi:MAG: hypothetical protein WKG07_43910 [Hymenobacter sp.]
MLPRFRCSFARRGAMPALLALLSLVSTTACGQTTHHRAAPTPATVTDSATGKLDMPWLRQRLDSSWTFRRHASRRGSGRCRHRRSRCFGYNEARYFAPGQHHEAAEPGRRPGACSAIRCPACATSRGATRCFSRAPATSPFCTATCPRGGPTPSWPPGPKKCWPTATSPACRPTAPAGPGTTTATTFSPSARAFPVFGNTVRLYAAAPLVLRGRRARQCGRCPARAGAAAQLQRPLAGAGGRADFRSPPRPGTATRVRAPLENRFTYAAGSPKKVGGRGALTAPAAPCCCACWATRCAGPSWARRLAARARGRDSIRTLRGLPADSLYRRMLRVSDTLPGRAAAADAAAAVGRRDSLSSDRADSPFA